MTAICKSTEVPFRQLVETTSQFSRYPIQGDRQVYEYVRDILHYDVRAIADPSQGWFWTDEWQEREREADADIAAGRTTVFASGDDFLEHLRSDDID